MRFPARQPSSSPSGSWPAETQTARLKLEKRPKGKVVTVVGGLDPEGNDRDSHRRGGSKASAGPAGHVKDI